MIAGLGDQTGSIQQLASVTSVANPNGSKGAWKELVSAANNKYGATQFEALLTLSNTLVGTIDIGLGDDPTNCIILADWLYIPTGYQYIKLPLNIPPGYKVSVRAGNSGTGSNSINFNYPRLVTQSFKPRHGFKSITSLGATGCKGTDVLPGTSPAYCDPVLIGTTTQRAKALMIVCCGKGNGASETCSFQVVDVSGNNLVSASHEPLASKYYGNTGSWYWGPYYLDLPAASFYIKAKATTPATHSAMLYLFH